MQHTLISFLGRFESFERKGYRTADYDFGDGVPAVTAFFSLGLLRHLRGKAGAAPDRFIVLGTAGSMWDSFVHAVLTDEGLEDVEEWVSLGDAAQENRTEQAMLDRYNARLGAVLGVSCELILISYARDIIEQTDLLWTISASLRQGESVTLDLTHGLRHLPIVGMVSAKLISATGRATIAGIYYGALELTPRPKGQTPVLRLDGLAQVDRWLAAAQIFDHTGDYGVFASLLEEDGSTPETARLLKSAAFLEQVNRIDQAQEVLQRFRKRLVGELANMPMSRLFSPMLDRRLDWVEKNDPYQRLRDLALSGLEHRDYVRAAVHGFEAFLRRLREPPAEWTDADRKQGVAAANPEKRYYEFIMGSRARNQGTKTQRMTYEAYLGLRDLRNTSVHGSASRNLAAKKALKSPEDCAATLERWFRMLLPAPAPGVADRTLDY